MEKCLDPSSSSRYDAALFTLPKPQFVSCPRQVQLLHGILLGKSSSQLQKLDEEAVSALPELKRLKKGGDIGFFGQGILTGLVVFLSTGVACVGAMGYFGVKLARPRFQGL